MTEHRTDDIARGADVALVHDYLTQRGGAERVVLELAQAFPEAPLYTSLHDPERTFTEFRGMDIRAGWLNRVGALRSDHRRAAPILAPYYSRLTIDADAVLCSSSGWAHGVRTEGRKIVYCHNPARWLYQADLYNQELPRAARAFSRSMAPALRAWDRRAAASVDRYITNSNAVRRRVGEAYGIDAEVIHPPTSLVAEGEGEPVEGIEPGYLLCVARLLPYKNVDVVIEALDHLPRDVRLIVVGRGPDRERLDFVAEGRNADLLGTVTDAQLRWLYRNSSALVASSFEDFGLTPVEASMFGKPTVAMRWGGFLDTIVEDLNGLFFDEPIPTEIAAAIERAHKTDWDGSAITDHAELFSRERFRRRMRDVVLGG